MVAVAVGYGPGRDDSNFLVLSSFKKIAYGISVFPFLILNKINVQIFCLWLCHVNFFFLF